MRSCARVDGAQLVVVTAVVELVTAGNNSVVGRRKASTGFQEPVQPSSGSSEARRRSAALFARPITWRYEVSPVEGTENEASVANGHEGSTVFDVSMQ